MTVSESIINWLYGYDTNVDGIDTDIVSASTASYALSKEPTVNIKKYLSGKVERTEYYQLTARLDSQTNADRKDNTMWLEGLEKWVKEQTEQGNVPIVNGKPVTDIYISSSFYLGRNAEDNSLYSLTMAIRYTI